MPINLNIGKLDHIKDLLAKVYESEVKDDVHDNGNLDSLNSAIKSVENVLRVLKQRSSEV